MKVRAPRGEGVPKVAVVIVSYNTRDDLLRCLTSLAHVAGTLEIVVVDNASQDGSAAAVRGAHPAVRVIENPSNEGYARANNRGLQATSAPLVLLLNSDCELRPGALETLVAVLESRPEAGIVGPRTVGSDGRIQVSTGPSLTPLREWRQRRLVLGVKRGDASSLARAEAIHARAFEPVWVSGACLLTRRSALEAVGGFDEDFFLYEEDVDLCLRVRERGYRVLFEPGAEVVHHLGRSVAQDPKAARLHYQRSHLLYYRKHNPGLPVLLLRVYLAGLALARALRPHGAGEARSLLALALAGK